MESDLSKRSKTSNYTTALNSSAFRVQSQNPSSQTQNTTDISSYSTNTDQSRNTLAQNTKQGKESVKLVPLKVKDLKKIFKNIPEYSNRKPVTINIKENDIDEVVEQQRYNNRISSASKHIPLGKSIQASPISLRHLEEYIKQKKIQEQIMASRYNQSSTEEPIFRSKKRSDDVPKYSKSRPPLRVEQDMPQVYAMTEVQAFPMRDDGFKIKKSNTQRRQTPRIRKSRGPKPSWYRTRSKSPHLQSRGRSRRHRSPGNKPPARVRSPRRRRSPLVMRKRRPFANCYPGCNPYPMCDTNLCNFNNRPLSLHRERYTPSMRLLGEDEYLGRRHSSRPLIGEDEYLGRRYSRPIRHGHSSLLMRKGHERLRQGYCGAEVNCSMNNCDCCLCQEKLQFIQPGVCSKRKDMWTNEYAIIPKPQINLIDPCKELDPTIYPRAERPCIRDGRGNPLTDCIGRPLRDPVGKRFLRFSANGSVMDTNFNGNFYSGQPPLCVKCPLPGSSCAPDATHNWWMSCGYPISPNMTPYFNSVVAAENCRRQCTK